jgi:hypothetical protein
MILKETNSSIAMSSSQLRILNLQKDNSLLYVQCVVEINIETDFSPSDKQLGFGSEFNAGKFPVEVKGQINTEKLHNAAGLLLDKYDALRISYQWNDALQSGTQVFNNSKGINFETIEIESNESYHAYLDYQRKKIYDLNHSSEALLNILFVKISDSSGLLLLLIPAIAADSTSLKNIARDLSSFYLDKESLNQDAVIPYQKFCNWQQDLSQDPGDEAILYWKKYNYKQYINIKLPF